MHTDNYKSKASLPAALFNQIYLELRERDRGSEAVMKTMKKHSSEMVQSFFLV